MSVCAAVELKGRAEVRWGHVGAVPEGAAVSLTCDSGSAYNPPAKITWHHVWPRWATEARAATTPRANSTRIVPAPPPLPPSAAGSRGNSSLWSRVVSSGKAGIGTANSRNGQQPAETSTPAPVAKGDWSFGALQTLSTLTLGRVARTDNGAAFRCRVSHAPFAPEPVDVPFVLSVACVQRSVYCSLFSVSVLTMPTMFAM